MFFMLSARASEASKKLQNDRAKLIASPAGFNQLIQRLVTGLNKMIYCLR